MMPDTTIPPNWQGRIRDGRLNELKSENTRVRDILEKVMAADNPPLAGVVVHHVEGGK
jgi:hypothetical protein